MKVYEYRHRAPYFTSRILDGYFAGMRLGIFDIETMGLSPDRAACVLAGLDEGRAGRQLRDAAVLR